VAQARVVIDRPSSVYIRFTQEMPKLFVIYDPSGDVHYFRYLNGSTPRIKFRMPIHGVYSTDTPIEVIKIVPIEIPDTVIKPNLPPAERDRWKPVSYRYNKDLGTVARIDTMTGIIEHGPRYKQLIKPLQVFIDEHEKAHMFYLTEENCDLLALINFIRMGYNESTAYYALSMVLKKSAMQMERTKELYRNIVEGLQTNFNPGV
jgi:hypothetical protein